MGKGGGPALLLTVTLNPSVDKLYRVKGLRQGAVVRVDAVHNTAGGKGLNVARVAALLGQPVQAMGFLGGHTGALLQDLLRGSGVEPCFTPAAGETRCCINIRQPGSRLGTELLEPGSPVSAAEAEQFLRDFSARLPGAGAVALSGSMPRGLPVDFYAKLTGLAKRAGCPVLLDTSGPALAAALAAGPDLIKPNAEEAGGLLGCAVEGPDGALAAARQLRRRGAVCAVVSLGSRGAVASGPGGDFYGETPDLPVVNTVGCGDSMMAAFAVGTVRGLPAARQLQLALAVSTANALTEETGSFCPGDLRGLMEKVRVTRAEGGANLG